MTILLIMEAIDNGQLNLTDMISCSTNASSMGGSQIWLDTTESLSVNDMLKAICVVSANDCSVAMAEHLCGTQELFVEKMNQRAKELGMNDTCFKNCHGIDEDGHLTSSYDIALMSRELLKNYPSITNYTTIWMDSLRDGKSELVNTNKLVRNYNGCTGLKTGSTSLALYNLSASATRDDMSLIAVVLKAPSTAVRFSEAKKLLDYGFANYCVKNFAKSNDILKTISVEKGVEELVEVVYESDCNILIKKGEEKNINHELILEEKISAPISHGQKLGEIKFFLGENNIETVNLIANKQVQKTGLLNMTNYIYTKWFNLLR